MTTPDQARDICQSWSDGVPQGWLPVGIGQCLRWMQVDGAPLTEPFFGRSVDVMRAKTPPRTERETEFSVLRRVTDYLPAKVPAGVVFHMSRCGSTLVMNGLRWAETAFSLAEDPLFGRVMQWAVTVRILAGRRHWIAYAAVDSFCALSGFASPKRGHKDRNGGCRVYARAEGRVAGGSILDH